MKNLKAKKLMIGCIKTRDNGEVDLVEKVSIKTSNLVEGSVMARSTYLGDVDTPEAIGAVRSFMSKLSMNKEKEDFTYV
jgi:hypothetical protein